MTNYKFSVSTSFYRRGDFVQSLYQQLLAQTHTNWEWIVTDDFSDFNSAEEQLREIAAKDSRVKYIEQAFKRQLFYNPQIGCEGDIVLQTDSDDIIAPKLLQVYNYWFGKKPDVYGMSCGWIAKENMHYPSIDGKWVTNSHFDFKHQHKVESMTMGRAWRNVIPHFECEGMKYFQNDTNILRHVENIGKWFWIPRVLYGYNYTEDSLCKRKRSDREIREIEEERQVIENRFPKLNNPERCTFVTDYINMLDKLVCLYDADQCNFSDKSHNINIIDPSLQPWEMEKIRELYGDWNIYFNYFEGDVEFDEITSAITPTNEKELLESIEKLRDIHPEAIFKIYFKLDEFDMDYWRNNFGWFVYTITGKEEKTWDGFVRIRL